MRLLVCGGRTFDGKEPLWRAIKFLNPSVIIEGGATGADRLAQHYAKRFGVTLDTYEADWDKHGRSAGIIRNIEMLTKGKPDIVLACPGGRGTEDMIVRAQKAKVPVYFLGPDAEIRKFRDENG